MQDSIRQWDAELTALHARIGSRFRRA
ncbi:hypothetical protein JOD69_004207, partial [Methylocaldum sp. RMAD-M]|nr:hypothetical protein [Methylocaldum sp. RMAD-M]